MTMYNPIHYERLQTQRSYDTYTSGLPKTINSNNKSHTTVKELRLSLPASTSCFLLQGIGQMTPITNISMTSSTNTTMTTPQPTLTYTPSGIMQKSQTDLTISKLPSSTLVDLLKQRRSPPPPRTSLTTRQQKQNSTVKQTKKSSEKSQAQSKRPSINNDHQIRVDINLLQRVCRNSFYFH